MEYRKIDYDGFDWDGGNTLKVKERVSIEQVELVFKNEVLFFKDEIHSTLAEERFIAVSETSENRILFIIFTFRKIENKNLLRIISSRYTHQKERELYEKIKKSF